MPGKQIDGAEAGILVRTQTLYCPLQRERVGEGEQEMSFFICSFTHSFVIAF